LILVSLYTQDIIQNNEEQNLKNILKYATKAAKERDSTILLTPELSLQGFPEPADNDLPKAVPVTGLSIEKIKHTALTLKMFIGFGYFEEYQDIIYNTYSIAGPAGTLITTQRKRKTFKFAKEDLYVKASNKTNDFDLLDFKTRIVICFGLRFPQLFSCEGEKPSLYIVPANWPMPRINHWEALLISRAIENQAWIIGINRTGGNYNGHSMVIDPNGKIIVKNNGSLASFSIHKETVTQIREQFPLD